MWIPRWARKDSRLDRWYLASFWHAALFNSTVVGVVCFVAAVIDNNGFAFSVLVGILGFVITLVLIALRLLWAYIRFRMPKQP